MKHQKIQNKIKFKISAFQKSLLGWYEQNKRDLPWRKTKDPYSIWVSEIILQQTQIKTGLPYYLKFLKKFPTVSHLAKASEQEVLNAWAGLGYYRRARFLHRGAREVMSRFQGVVPNTYDEFLSLPGVGPYTAAAVLSIAHGLPYGVLDGNVERVLCRLFAIGKDPRDSAVKKELWILANELLEKENSGDFNQAMMELGATVCTPTKPTCLSCPVSRVCFAKKENHQEGYPKFEKKEKVTPLSRFLFLLEDQRGRVLLRKRPEGEWHSGLWDFPGGKSEEWASQKKKLKLQESKSSPKLVASVKHPITKYRVTSGIYEIKTKPGFRKPGGEDWKWVSREELYGERDSFPSPTRKLVEKLERQ